MGEDFDLETDDEDDDVYSEPTPDTTPEVNRGYIAFLNELQAFYLPAQIDPSKLNECMYAAFKYLAERLLRLPRPPPA